MLYHNIQARNSLMVYVKEITPVFMLSGICVGKDCVE